MFCPARSRSQSALKFLITTSYRSSSNSYYNNHYDTLGVNRESSKDEIKRAYYEMSKRYHPDKEDGSPAKFQEITNAYEVLGNPRLRKMYDKGLFSESSSAIYEGSNSAYNAESYTDSYRKPSAIPNLDNWAKEQYSATFNRDQTRRDKIEFRENLKRKKTQAKGVEVLLLLMLAFVFICGYNLDFSKKKPKP